MLCRAELLRFFRLIVFYSPVARDQPRRNWISAWKFFYTCFFRHVEVRLVLFDVFSTLVHSPPLLHHNFERFFGNVEKSTCIGKFYAEIHLRRVHKHSLFLFRIEDPSATKTTLGLKAAWVK